MKRDSCVLMCLILKEGRGIGFVRSDLAGVQECLSDYQEFPAKVKQVHFKCSGHAELLSIATSNSSKR